MMKNPLIYCFLIVFGGFMIACEENVPDLKNSDFSLQGIHENEEVFGIVNLKLDSARSTEFESVSFFVDNELLTEDAEAPYEAEWNTYDYKDGEHTLAVEVFAGDVSEKRSYTVTVNNSLARITLTDPNFNVEEALYAFITDSTGKPVGDYVELKQNEEVVIARPETFTSREFDLNLMVKEESDQEYNFLTIVTYEGVKAGTFTFDKMNYKEPEEQGSFTIEITNIPENHNARFYGDAPWNYAYQQGDVIAGTARMLGRFYEEQPLLIEYKDDENNLYKYFLTEEISSGDELTVDFGNFKDMEVDSFAEFSSSDTYKEYWVIGKLDNVAHPYFLGASEPVNENNEFRMVYAPGGFNSYAWFRDEYGEGSGAYYFSRKKSDTRPDFSPMNIEFMSSAVSADEVSGQVKGDFDIYLVIFSSYIEEAGSYYIGTRVVMGSDEEIKVKPMELPQELFNHYDKFFAEDYLPEVLVVLDFKSINGRQGVYDILFKENTSPFMESLVSSSETMDEDYQGVEYELMPGEQVGAQLREKMKRKGVEHRRFQPTFKEMKEMREQKQEERRKER